FVGSLENSVMPQARRFNELEVEGTSNQLAYLTPIDLDPRQLRSDRDVSAAAGAPGGANPICDTGGPTIEIALAPGKLARASR
ncbi:MAG TPA: hypothetical protein VGI28_07860, partial [Stellaceae bacterium]